MTGLRCASAGGSGRAIRLFAALSCADLDKGAGRPRALDRRSRQALWPSWQRAREDRQTGETDRGTKTMTLIQARAGVRVRTLLALVALALGLIALAPS